MLTWFGYNERVALQKLLSTSNTFRKSFSLTDLALLSSGKRVPVMSSRHPPVLGLESPPGLKQDFLTQTEILDQGLRAPQNPEKLVYFQPLKTNLQSPMS